MGAIYGVFGDSEARELSAMGSRLAHRGLSARGWRPAGGVWFGNRFTAGECAEVCYGAPVNFHGVIENRDEVAALCGLDELDPASDSTLLLELYRRFGPEGFGPIIGQFAVVLSNCAARCLVVARDAWSICPLYGSRVSGRCLFSSEYKTLLASDGVPARL